MSDFVKIARLPAMKDSYDLNNLLLSMAGSGNPWAAITPFRKGLLRALHDGLSVSDVAKFFGISLDKIRKELNPLIVANLLVRKGKNYVPTFFIADASETQCVVSHAQTIGDLLARQLLTIWPQIETTYRKLTVSELSSLCDLGFMLVGAHILDIGLLEALKDDRILMKPAPARPGPDSPKAHYYFWMIEGNLPDLGSYGLDDTILPWPDWYFLSFGQSWINGIRNSDRDALEETCEKLIRSNAVENPESLAKSLKVPVFTKTDTSHWLKLAEECARSLVAVYVEHEKMLRKLFLSLRASEYAPHGFSEFFCWYDHVAYARAIDVLETQGLISIPAQRFTAALWHSESQIRGVL